MGLPFFDDVKLSEDFQIFFQQAAKPVQNPDREN